MCTKIAKGLKYYALNMRVNHLFLHARSSAPSGRVYIVETDEPNLPNTGSEEKTAELCRTALRLSSNCRAVPLPDPQGLLSVYSGFDLSADLSKRMVLFG
jgi:hypothetical protein